MKYVFEKILSHPAWTGIGGIVAVLALIYAIMPFEFENTDKLSQEKIISSVKKSLSDVEKNSIRINDPINVFARDYPESYNTKCNETEKHLKIIKGLAYVYSYYYIFRSYYIDNNNKTFEYPWNYASNFNIFDFLKVKSEEKIQEDISSNYHYTMFNNEEIKSSILSAIEIFIDYKKRFDEGYNPETKLIINSYKDIESLNFYDLGFPKSENKCFTEVQAIGDIKLENGKNTFILIDSIEHYMYGFWKRRYFEGNQEKVHNLLKFFVYLVNNNYGER